MNTEPLKKMPYATRECLKKFADDYPELAPMMLVAIAHWLRSPRGSFERFLATWESEDDKSFAVRLAWMDTKGEASK